MSGPVPFPGAAVALDWELQNLTNTRYPEVRASGFINPGAPRTVRVAIRFHD